MVKWENIDPEIEEFTDIFPELALSIFPKKKTTDVCKHFRNFHSNSNHHIYIFLKIRFSNLANFLYSFFSLTDGYISSRQPQNFTYDEQLFSALLLIDVL